MEEEQGSKSPFSLLAETISPSSLKVASHSRMSISISIRKTNMLVFLALVLMLMRK